MSVHYHELELVTKGEVDMINIADDVQQVVSSSSINEGIVCIFVPGSTGTLTTIEFEPGLQKDFPRMLNTVAPKGIPYDHHNTWHDDNGHSHVRASLMGPSLTMPIHKGKLIHGTWQQLVFIELDTQPRQRKLIVQIIGE